MIPILLPPPDELLQDPLYTQLKAYLIEATGLTYYADKDADLVRRLRRRLSDLGIRDCASYLQRLRESSDGPSEMDSLISEITIGETYFFRHREHFDALRDIVLPDLINRMGGKRHLRIWCAGCADGAEPYSLSIVLRRELAPLLCGYSVSILGTDLNRQCLESAREGRFEDWSLRSTPEDIRTACFKKQGKYWILAPEYKNGVSFQHHNLVEGSYPPLSDASAFDLIICRNVMIYFGAERMRRIIRQFHGCLEPGAWLLVGPTEPNMTCFTDFAAVNAPGVTLYQKVPGSMPKFIESLPFPFPEPDAPAPLFSAADTALPVPPAAVPTLAQMRQHSDHGDWENAARCGKELIEADKLNSLAHFHYALVLEQVGNHAESERALRNAIYLDRHAVLAHYHLGVLLRTRGAFRDAERCFQNALQLLEAPPGDQVLADADGITAGELKNLAQMQIENLRVRI